LHYWFFIVLHLLVWVSFSGCGTLPNGRGWGEDATLFSDRERIGKAALNSLKDPDTWVPAIGAAAFSIGDWDERVSEWAYEKTPIFGSEERAQKASDTLLMALSTGAFGSALLTPGGDDPWPWAVSKLKGLAVEGGALWATGLATQSLKRWTGRERPNGMSDMSFPSMHSAHAFGFSKLALRNLESLPLTRRERLYLGVGLRTTAAFTAWARIESHMHYPKDVLAGAALGSFITRFIHDAFLGLDRNRSVELAVAPGSHGLFYLLRFKF